MVDVPVLTMTIWGVLITCAVAVCLAISAVAWAWLVRRRRRAQQVAEGIRATEQHLIAAARDHSAR